MSTIRQNRPKDTAERRSETIEHERAQAAATLAARENAVFAREQAVLARELAVERREAMADLRQKAADLREQVAVRRAHTEAQLREANEQLVIATLHAQTITEAAEHTAAQMSFRAERDVLTGLPNRALLTDRLAQAIAFAHRHGKKVALLYVDLDHFKTINDSFGHPVGDGLLQSVANRLQACVRDSDTVSRMGGDEFVVLLAEVVAVENASLIAGKLVRAMADPHQIGEHSINVTLSIGISLYPDDGLDIDAILTNADTAMYHAKRSGRSNYQRFTPDMNTRASALQARSIESD